MQSEALARHVRATLLRQSVQWTVGRLLADRTRAGEVVPLDPATGGELNDTVDDRPAFILSTENEATDGHIVRQFWDLSRAESGIAPILHNHDADRDLGLWQDLTVRTDLGDEIVKGPALVGRAYFDMEDPAAVRMRGKVKRGFIRSTSVGWIPGEPVRRGSLAEGDPLRRPMADDECGQPAEGLVMGSRAKPNIFVEGTLTPIPADQRALGLERVYGRGSRVLERVARAANIPLSRVAGAGGELGDGDIDALLALLAADPRVERHLVRLVTRVVETTTTAPKGRTVGQLLQRGTPQ